VRREWRSGDIAGLIEARYDAVLVYGMPEVLDFEATYGLSATVARRMSYTAFAGLGLLRVLEPDALDPGALRREIAGALLNSRERLAARARAMLDFGGAARAAHHLIEQAERSSHRGAFAATALRAAATGSP
jgi:predicted glycosyltransferase